MRADEVTPELISAQKNRSDQLWMFARYCQQTVGTPIPEISKFPALAKKVKSLQIEYPHMDWYSFCRITQWCRANKVRPRTTVGLVSCFRSAWKDGYLPELDPQQFDKEVERRIQAALEVETEDSWRERLLMAQGVTARRAAVEEWEAKSGLSAPSATTAPSPTAKKRTAGSSTSGSRKKRPSSVSTTPIEVGDEVLLGRETGVYRVKELKGDAVVLYGGTRLQWRHVKLTQVRRRKP